MREQARVPIVLGRGHLERLAHSMLLILIPVVWLAIAALFVALCRMAARGDAAMISTPKPGTPSSTFAGLVLFEDRSGRMPRDERLGRSTRPMASTGRTRRARCVAR
jgi:hypothetical protein